MEYDPKETITEGTITEEQWTKMAKWFLEGKSIFYEILRECEEKRTDPTRKEGETKRGRKES